MVAAGRLEANEVSVFRNNQPYDDFRPRLRGSLSENDWEGVCCVLQRRDWWAAVNCGPSQRGLENTLGIPLLPSAEQTCSW